MQPASAAWAAARATASTSAAAPSPVSRPAASIRSASRSSVFSDVIGVGRAPRWASTTSRWTVLEPTSSTPSRFEPVTCAPSGFEGATLRSGGERRLNPGRTNGYAGAGRATASGSPRRLAPPPHTVLLTPEVVDLGDTCRDLG